MADNKENKKNEKLEEKKTSKKTTKKEVSKKKDNSKKTFEKEVKKSTQKIVERKYDIDELCSMFSISKFEAKSYYLINNINKNEKITIKQFRSFFKK